MKVGGGGGGQEQLSRTTEGLKGNSKGQQETDSEPWPVAVVVTSQWGPGGGGGLLLKGPVSEGRRNSRRGNLLYEGRKGVREAL